MILEVPYSLSQVKAFRGVVDFYFRGKTPIARAWPTVSHCPRTPEQQNHWQRMRDLAAWCRKQPSSYMAAAKTSGLPPTYSSADAVRRAGYALVKNGLSPFMPDVLHVLLSLDAIAQTTTAVITQGARPSLNGPDFTWLAAAAIRGNNRVHWFVSAQPCNRHHHIYKRWSPILSPFIAPLVCDYDPIGCTWRVEFPLYADNLLLTPHHTDPRMSRVYLGAAYQSRTYEP